MVCVGHASVDHHFHVDQFSSTPTKTPAQSYQMMLGGMAANAAVAAARLGAHVRFVGRIGDDANADFVRGQLQSEGIDCSGLLNVPGKQTSVSSVVVDGAGERQVFSHRGSAISQSPPPLDDVHLLGANAVLCDPRWSDGAHAALLWAKQHAVLSVLDADIAPPYVLARLVAVCDWAAFSEGGLAQFSKGLNTVQGLRLAERSGAGHALVTVGAAGLHWLQEGSLAHMPAPAVKATDTTAAGDVFHAALTLALAEGQPTLDALCFASMAAAIKCERGTGVFGAPRRADVHARMAAQTTTQGRACPATF